MMCSIALVADRSRAGLELYSLPVGVWMHDPGIFCAVADDFGVAFGSDRREMVVDQVFDQLLLAADLFGLGAVRGNVP